VIRRCLTRTDRHFVNGLITVLSSSAVLSCERRPRPLAEEAAPTTLLTHTSPLDWEHISLSGDFLWDRAAAVPDGRRPINIGRTKRSRNPTPFLPRSTLALLSDSRDVIPSHTVSRRAGLAGLSGASSARVRIAGGRYQAVPGVPIVEEHPLPIA
jgi:hypothetical protein